MDASIPSDQIPGGVRRISKSRGGNTYWYWAALWIDRQDKWEYYPEAIFGPEKARELAIEAKRTEDSFTQRLKVKGLTVEEVVAIRVERNAAMQARLDAIRARAQEARGLIRGVQYDSRMNRYVARWTSDKPRSQSFSVRKYGDEGAKKMAIDLRRHWEEWKFNLRARPLFLD
jgi:hypothetical protein